MVLLSDIAMALWSLVVEAQNMAAGHVPQVASGEAGRGGRAVQLSAAPGSDERTIR